MQIGTTLPNERASIGVQATLKWLGSRRLVLVGIALGVIGAGLTWQWSWLVAIGIAPLLVSVAPCVAMCALGLCMGFRGSSAASNNAASKVATAVPQLLDHTVDDAPPLSAAQERELTPVREREPATFS